MRELNNVWDFVAKYYPNYESSDEIAENEDLCKLYNGEYQDGDDAHTMLMENYGGELDSISKALIARDLNYSLRVIYEQAIEAYLLTLDK